MHPVHLFQRGLSLATHAICTLLLVFFPIPIGPMRWKLAGYKRPDGGLEFYSHPNIACCCHLIWVGWLLTLVELYNRSSIAETGMRVSSCPLCWFWLLTLIITIVVLGLQFDRVACGFLAAGVGLFVLSALVFSLKFDLPLFTQFRTLLQQVPVTLSWGIPLLVSLILGSTFAAVATWQSWNDRWIIPTGNYIEHVNFQSRDRAISRGARSFVAVFDCLVRRYLCFGYGDIEIRSHADKLLLVRIEGVFFASHHAEYIRKRLSRFQVDFDEAEEDDELDGELG